ncbi:nuclear transport factor 2 family protein, partial [Kaistella sp.]|uniref:nuclear transport factor 2 family protein n=1 Tax=Kaistella sp. TaxID=2782235 RepID=UPI002F929A4B
WNFRSLKRSITFSKDGTYAWFDEVLDTQMKICRGSGVLEKIGGKWKIRQYVLSTTVPNEVIDEVVKIKTPIEDALISELKK